MGELQPCFIAFGEQLEGHKGITRIPLITPAVGKLSARYYFRYPAQVQVRMLLCPAGELEFESYFRPEFRQVKIPLLHIVFVCNGLPYLINGGIERAFKYQWFVFHLPGYLTFIQLRVTDRLQFIRNLSVTQIFFMNSYLCRMDYFKKQLDLLKIEREEDRQSYLQLTQSSSITTRRENGLTWYPIAIRDTELGRGDYLTVEVERTTHQDLSHQFRSGVSAVLFSNHDPKQDHIEGTVSFQSGNRMKIALRTDELPEWSRDGKLGVDLLFDDNSYDEMQNALKQAGTRYEKNEEDRVIRILTGDKPATFRDDLAPISIPSLNASQQAAVNRILAANEVAVVHGPPGTGKTTTLVQAIKAIIQQERQQVLVVAPSTATVDLLSEKLSDQGLNVLRVGNPARVSDRLLSLTLDSKMAEHNGMKDIKRLKKQASEFRDMAHKYKRNFGKAERDQRKALFDEARNIMKQVENTEQYIIEDLLNKAQVITATLVGANNYLVRQQKYKTVVIDEAGQALEPACWIPILKAQ